MPSAHRILLVEDETIVAMDLARGLGLLGYEIVATTGDGDESVLLAGRLRPDLILMDIRLQGATDGIDAARTIRQRFQIPVIFLTAHADAATVERAKTAEPFGYLLKPFADAELHSAIEIALHKQALERSALREAGEALRRSEHLYQLLVDSLRDHAVFLLDPRGYIVTWNTGAHRMNGYSQSEILGHHYSIFFPPDEIVRNRPDQLLWRAARDGQAQEQGWLVRKDASRFFADCLVTALRRSVVASGGAHPAPPPSGAGGLPGAQPFPTGFAVLARDITAQKHAEDEIRRLNATLERRVRERTSELRLANQELEAFTYTVAHDLRGPLRGLRGLLSILSTELDPAPSSTGLASELVSRATASAERMMHLIDGLLNLSGVGRKELTFETVPLADLLHQARLDLPPELRAVPVEWRIGSLPDVRCDPGLVREALANLLSNAVKYSVRSPEPVVTVGHMLRDGESVFFVSDNGAGFDPRYAGKLFKPFSRLHRADEFPGTGVGLATVERIIRRHGGRIWAESAPGKGATFYFTLGAQAVADRKEACRQQPMQ